MSIIHHFLCFLSNHETAIIIKINTRSNSDSIRLVECKNEKCAFRLSGLSQLICTIKPLKRIKKFGSEVM